MSNDNLWIYIERTKTRGKLLKLGRVTLKKNNVLSFTKMSSSYKFCVIAAGEADIYTCEPRAYEWDIAAGHAIIKHSGGIITTSSGKEILYGKERYKNPSLLVKRSINLEI